MLSMEELATVWKATDGYTDYEKIVRLLMLTGARADEIGCMEWSEINLDHRLICIPPERMKNRREHRIFLSEPAAEILCSCHATPEEGTCLRADAERSILGLVEGQGAA